VPKTPRYESLRGVTHNCELLCEFATICKNDLTHSSVTEVRLVDEKTKGRKSHLIVSLRPDMVQVCLGRIRIRIGSKCTLCILYINTSRNIVWISCSFKIYYMSTRDMKELLAFNFFSFHWSIYITVKKSQAWRRPETCMRRKIPSSIKIDRKNPSSNRAARSTCMAAFSVPYMFRACVTLGFFNSHKTDNGPTYPCKNFFTVFLCKKTLFLRYS
jgi:hypothetical protein